MDILQLGPFVIELKFILAYFLVAAFFFIEKKMTRSPHLKVKDYSFYAVITGLVSGRAFFVLQNLDHYSAHVFSALNIFDRDFDFYGAIVGSLFFTLAYFHKSADRIKQIAKRVILILLLSGIYLCSLYFISLTKEPTTIIPSTLKNQDISDLLCSSKPKIINYWATWCPPCVKEMPVLIEGSEQNPDIIFIFVNQHEDPWEIEAFEERLNISIPHLVYDDGTLGTMKLGKALPTTLFLDASNNLIDTHTGAITAPNLNNKMKQLRSEK